MSAVRKEPRSLEEINQARWIHAHREAQIRWPFSYAFLKKMYYQGRVHFHGPLVDADQVDRQIEAGWPVLDEAS